MPANSSQAALSRSTAAHPQLSLQWVPDQEQPVQNWGDSHPVCWECDPTGKQQPRPTAGGSGSCLFFPSCAGLTALVALFVKAETRWCLGRAVCVSFSIPRGPLRWLGALQGLGHRTAGSKEPQAHWYQHDLPTGGVASTQDRRPGPDLLLGLHVYFIDGNRNPSYIPI